MTGLVTTFESLLSITIDERGFSHPPLLARHHDGKITMATMMLPGEKIFDTVLEQFIADLTVRELVFGIDRFTQPDQGTKYADVLTVFWWVGEHSENYGFRFGVVDYVPPPNKVIEPIKWDNAFWNASMFKTVEASHRDTVRRVNQYRAADPDRVTLVEAQMKAAAKKARGF